MTYVFQGKLEFSRGIREQTDIETIKAMIDGCVSVVKTDTEQDKQGVDYIATLRKGAHILIDAKAREPGCSRFWRNGPELALELWSVRPGGKYGTPWEDRKTGWTLCESKDVDAILFTFDPSDTNEVFLVGFQHLRMAFRRNLKEWRRQFKAGIQDSVNGSSRWESECIFIPADTVLEAISDVSRGALPEPVLVVPESPMFQPPLIPYHPREVMK